MNIGKFVFAQIIEHIPRDAFTSCVKRYQGELYVKSFTARDQFLAMIFGQLTGRESLRDTVTCLEAHALKRYHLGFRSLPARSTLAEANENRDWRIWRDLALHLIGITKRLYTDEPAIAKDIEGSCYAVDSTSIDVCLTLVPWASFVSTKGAVKVHTQLDIRGSIPTYISITSGKVHDTNFMDTLCYELGAYYIFDRGYLDFSRLYRIEQAKSYFVIRGKLNMKFNRRYSRITLKNTGVLADQTIVLTGINTAVRYPIPLRRVKYRDQETGKTYVFLTNNFTINATSVALLYRNRWQVELFFRWIKQHLKIKVFWGYSENAVKTHICIALCAYLLVAILKKRLKIKADLYQILQILSISMFDKTLVVKGLFDGDYSDEQECFQDTLPLLGI